MAEEGKSVPGEELAKVVRIEAEEVRKKAFSTLYVGAAV